MRVAILGGSTAFGTGLDSDEQSLGPLIAKNCNAEVLNSAVIGYQSIQELITLVTTVMDYKPDIVVALNGYNDYAIGTDRDDKMLGLEHFLEDLSLLQRDNPAIHVSAALYYGLFPAIIREIRQLHNQLSQDFQRSDYEIQQTAENFTGNLIKMRSLAEQRAVKFIEVFQPSANVLSLQLGQKLPENLSSQVEFAQGLIRFRSLALQKLTQAGVNLVDAQSIPQLSYNHFMDDIHLNDQGTSLLAQTISAAICPDDKVSSTNVTN